VPALTFSGTALPVVHVGARPVFADVDPRTYNMDPESVRSRISGRTAAIMPVHLHGLPADLDELGAIAAAHGVPLIEDACQAPGATYRGRTIGSIGLAAGFSLNQTKPLWAGEGGIVTSDDDQLVRRIRRTRLFGEDIDAVPRSYLTTSVGFNWKATELQAALAREALRELDQTNENAASCGRLLSEALDERVLLAPWVPDGRTHTYHKYRALLARPEHEPDEVVAVCERNGVPACRWQVAPLSDHPALSAGAHDCPVARRILDHSIVLGTEAQPLAAAREVVKVWCERLVTVQLELARPAPGPGTRQ
jgi:dTDP-4-amino-4,6-dideoxygalactose transaminase